MVARDHSVRVILIFYAPTCMRVGVIAADSSLGTDELVEADGEVARGSCCQRAAGEKGKHDQTVHEGPLALGRRQLRI